MRSNDCCIWEETYKVSFLLTKLNEGSAENSQGFWAGGGDSE